MPTYPDCPEKEAIKRVSVCVYHMLNN